MNKHIFFSMVTVGIMACLVLPLNLAGAGEPRRPKVNKAFEPEVEKKIQRLASLGKQDAFNHLKRPDILFNRDLAYKAVYKAFAHRRSEAIELAKKYLKEPLVEYNEGRRITRSQDFNLAKKIFEVFPDESTPRLTAFYQSGEGIVRGNIIRVSGAIDGGAAIRDMLINALNDISAAEEVTPEQLGEPLRVCDVAYNQLVIRYHFRGILRTISQAHKVDIRDHHIGALKGRLPSTTH